MARISGVDLPRDKRIDIALTYIFGIGRGTAAKIVEKSGVDPSVRVHALSSDDVAKIRSVIASDFKVEGALRAEISMNIKRLMDIGCYRGLRHRRGLPVEASAHIQMRAQGVDADGPSAVKHANKIGLRQISVIGLEFTG